MAMDNRVGTDSESGAGGWGVAREEQWRGTWDNCYKTTIFKKYLERKIPYDYTHMSNQMNKLN